MAPPLAATDLLAPETFDSFPPAGWTLADLGPISRPWTADNSQQSPLSGGSAAFSWGGNSDAWLISPAMDFSTATVPFLSYMAYVEIGQQADTSEVLMSSDYAGSGDPSLATWTTLNDVIDPNEVWTPHILDVSAFSGQATVYLAFRNADTNTGARWRIDDVRIIDPPPREVEVRGPADGIQRIDSARTLTFHVTNTGATADTFNLAGAGSFFTSLSSMSTGVLAPGAFEIVTVTTTVPAGATPCAPEALSITATSQADGSVTAGATIQITPDFGLSGGGSPREGGYFFTNSLATCPPTVPSFDWIDISGTGTNITASLDGADAEGPFPIGFTFTYFGEDFTELYISGKGWISFDPSSTSAPNSGPQDRFLPNPDRPRGIIAGFWENLFPPDSSPGGNAVFYGNGPGGELVVTFNRISTIFGSADRWITFQIVLYQDGNIRIQIQDRGPGFAFFQPTIGIEDSPGFLGVQYHRDGTGGVVFDTPVAIEFGLDPTALPVELESFTVD